MSLVCVCIDIRDVIGDTSGGECVESVDIFIIRSLIFSLFIRSEFLSPLGLSGNVPFLNNLSILSLHNPVMSLKIGIFVTFVCIVLILRVSGHSDF